MIALIVTAYWGQTVVSREQQMVVEMQQNMRAAMHMLQRDIMMAGYDDDVDAAPSTTITTAGQQTFAYEYISDASGVVETVTYSLTGGGDLQRQTGGSAAVTIAQNIQDLEFFYTEDDGNQTSSPTNPSDVRSVGISILAATARETKTTSNRNFTTLGGNTWTCSPGFQCRMVKAEVQCRNMTGN